MTKFVSPLAFASFFLSSSLFSQSPDSTSLKEVVIQATRAGERMPVPHNNFRSKAI
ncbi:MAG: hypothetical protein RJA20_214, partial [Bacteroidota bacterium]